MELEKSWENTFRVYFSSNNLWFKRLIDIFKVYGFSINSLECYFSNNVQLKESLNDMRGSSIELTDIHQKVGIF